MPTLPDVFPQRRPIKLPDTFLSTSSKAALRNPSLMIDTQESFKGDPSHRTVIFHAPFRSYIKYIMVFIGFIAVVGASLIHGSGILLERANYLGRECFDVKPRYGKHGAGYKFAMVTCTGGAGRIPGRSFQGLMELVMPNKLSYVKLHGYDFIDASDLVDERRPPSWSKILAVREHLPNFDWVFWNDADSIVTNPTISLEDVIESAIVNSGEDETVPDFIVTKDVTGVNAGMFFFRNTEWSMQFLDLWWNQSSFIRPFGQMKSGDNDALKYLIENMPKEELQRHVRFPKMQCLFNSYLWRPSLKSSHRLMALTKTVWQGVYSKGDFMLHLAGLNDKKMHVKKVLRTLAHEQNKSENRSRKVGATY